MFIIDLTPGGPAIHRRYDWNDSLFDVTWSEANENICITGSGDGRIQVWDTAQPQGPIQSFKEHTKEVQLILKVHINFSPKSNIAILTSNIYFIGTFNIPKLSHISGPATRNFKIKFNICIHKIWLFLRYTVWTGVKQETLTMYCRVHGTKQ